MKKYSLFSRRAALLFAFCIATASTHATPIVTGEAVNSGQLMSGQNLKSGNTQGNNVKVYLENASLTLSANLTVNRIGPNFGTFATAGSGSGVISAGTTIIDYLLHYDHAGTGGGNNAIGTVTFDSPILGLIVFSGALNGSNSVFALGGVTYSTNSLRGLDTNAQNNGHGDDEFHVSADGRTLYIEGWTTIDVVDEIRVILAPPAVPEGGSSVVLLGLSFALLCIFAARRKILAID